MVELDAKKLHDLLHTLETHKRFMGVAAAMQGSTVAFNQD
jgi:hypothetical protein